MPRFSQGQLYVVEHLPTDQVDELQLKLVPPGHVHFYPADILNAHAWETFSLTPEGGNVCFLSAGHIKARRHQYRVTYCVCSTVHRAIGDTCPRIATQMSVQNHKFRLWEKEQMLVVLSRVQSLDYILFVTQCPNDTVLFMIKLLQQKSPWSKQIDRIVTTLDVTSRDARALVPDLDQEHPMQLPDTSNGFVYMLVSVPHRRFAYVGETSSISRRLSEHNSGRGANFTKKAHLIPWSCRVLVSRFPGNGADEQNVRLRKQFESYWHRLNGQDVYPDTRSILANGRVVFDDFRRHHQDLLWQEFGRIVQH